MLHPDFPIVDGRYRMTDDWAITLPQQFNRRIEDDSLVLWRPGVTIWIIVWNNDKGESQQERLAWLRVGSASNALETELQTESDITWYSYRLTEFHEDEAVHGFYGFAIGVGSHVQMAIYVDEETELQTAREIFRSLGETPVG
jgi:hypothetical protein